jgi:hypothetical protein
MKNKKARAMRAFLFGIGISDSPMRFPKTAANSELVLA